MHTAALVTAVDTAHTLRDISDPEPDRGFLLPTAPVPARKLHHTHHSAPAKDAFPMLPRTRALVRGHWYTSAVSAVVAVQAPVPVREYPARIDPAVVVDDAAAVIDDIAVDAPEQAAQDATRRPTNLAATAAAGRTNLHRLRSRGLRQRRCHSSFSPEAAARPGTPSFYAVSGRSSGRNSAA